MNIFDTGNETVVAAFNLKGGDILFALRTNFRIYSHSRQTMIPVGYSLPKGMRIMSACMAKGGDMYFGTFSGDLYKINISIRPTGKMQNGFSCLTSAAARGAWAAIM